MITKRKLGYDYIDGENITLFDGDDEVGQLTGCEKAAQERAHLWEAAPDLLVTLEQVRDGIASGLFEGKSQDPDWYIEKINAAIAKAKPGSGRK